MGVRREQEHEDELLSEKWDHADREPQRLRYAILISPRTGSDLLCGYLRRCGVGIPYEYLNPINATTIAARIGALTPDKKIFADRYYNGIVKRRRKKGIFGIKLQADHPLIFNQQKRDKAIKFVQRFDRYIVLTRRDKIAQAISYVRAARTEQWHLYGNDKPEKVKLDDDAVNAAIAERLSKIMWDETLIQDYVAGIDPAKVLRIEYENMSESVMASAAAWLAQAAGIVIDAVDKNLDLPKKMDPREGEAIKRRFLQYIGA